MLEQPNGHTDSDNSTPISSNITNFDDKSSMQ